MNKLSIEEGLKIQQQHLDYWKTVLTPEAHGYLMAEAKRQNEELAAENARREKNNTKVRRFVDPILDGYDVWRGSSMDEFIGNMAMNGGKPREI